jgi:DNA-binding NarL/FixJ family response regulator
VNNIIVLERKDLNKYSPMCTVLIIDDAEQHVFATMLYLSDAGFRTFGSCSGEEALALLKNIEVDIIILDVIMPNMDGYRFIKNLNIGSRFQPIPFILLSAKGMTQDRIKGYCAGCSGYISKPFASEELVALINNVLFRKRKELLELRTILSNLRRIRLGLENQDALSGQCKNQVNLTPRERSVLRYLLSGLRNREISSILHTSLRNIEKYVTKLLRKTNTKNRVDLVNYYHKNKTMFKANDGIRTRA